MLARMPVTTIALNVSPFCASAAGVVSCAIAPVAAIMAK